MNLKNLQAQVHISTAAIILLNNFTFAFSVFGTLDDLTWKCSKGWGSWGRHGILNILSVFALKFSLNPVILWKPTITLALIRRITQKLFALNLGSFTRDKKSHELVWSGMVALEICKVMLLKMLHLHQNILHVFKRPTKKTINWEEQEFWTPT